jgi:heterodisulfide reductase subunit C
MINRQNKIEEIKATLRQLFSANSEPETDSSATEQAFGEYVLTDGTKITSSAKELEIGVEVYCVDELGNQTVLDSGDYVLTDGRTITIKDNLITEIKGEISTEPVSPVMDANNGSVTNMSEGEGLPVETEIEDPEEEIKKEVDLEKRVADLEATLTEVMDMLKAIADGQIKANDQMMSKINEIADEPGDVAIKLSKKGLGDYSKDGLKKTAHNNNLAELREMVAERQKNSNRLI